METNSPPFQRETSTKTQIKTSTYMPWVVNPSASSIEPSTIMLFAGSTLPPTETSTNMPLDSTTPNEPSSISQQHSSAPSTPSSPPPEVLRPSNLLPTLQRESITDDTTV